MLLVALLVSLLVASAMGCIERPTSDTVLLRFPVTNNSGQAARLEVVNSVTGAPMGSVTPALVPPNSRMDVVIEVPLSRAWVVYVNDGMPSGRPVVSGYDLFGCSGDVPIEVFVDRIGEPSWESHLAESCDGS